MASAAPSDAPASCRHSALWALLSIFGAVLAWVRGTARGTAIGGGATVPPTTGATATGGRLGSRVEQHGSCSTAIGGGTTAIGRSSTAIGGDTTAIGGRLYPRHVVAVWPRQCAASPRPAADQRGSAGEAIGAGQLVLHLFIGLCSTEWANQVEVASEYRTQIENTSSPIWKYDGV